MPKVPSEFDQAPHFGFTMRGWNFSCTEIEGAIAQHRMLNPAMELGTNVCPWNCDFCFTESPQNISGPKRALRGELSVERRLQLIDEAAALGARSINFVGAGEPTIDPEFWRLIERMRSQSIVPIIYTEGTLRLTQRHFAQRLFDLDATVVLKMNSRQDHAYQDRVLRGTRPKSGVPTKSYSQARERALEMLLDTGFAEPTPTRLAFDTIICRENVEEIEDLHRFARERNIFVLFVNYLPSGRTRDGHTSAISWAEQQVIFDRLAAIDRDDFQIEHGAQYPYAGGVPCTIRGLGLYVKIQGEVFDCPGEARRLGNLKEHSLSEIWETVRPITAGFDGRCLPRQEFWERMKQKETPSRPLLPSYPTGG